MNFCRTHIAIPPGLAPHHGVLADMALALTADAQLAAERLLAAARADAAALVESELARCRADIDARQRAALEQVQSMLAAFERMPRDFLARTEPIVIELAQALFLRLAGELAPAERAAALLRRLQAEAPPRLAEPVLHAHPADAAVLALPAGWSVRADHALAPGRLRLESSAGEWRVDFDAAVLALTLALVPDAEGAEISA